MNLMNVITIIPRFDDEPVAARLMHLAASRGWVGRICRRRGRRLDTRLPAVSRIAIPDDWLLEMPAGDVVRYGYDDRIDILGTGRTGGNGNTPLVIQNGRYAVEVDVDLLKEAVAGCRAQVLCIVVSERRQAYSESLRQTGDGKVLGFRRFYYPQSVPEPFPSDWPHLVFLEPSAAASLAADGVAPAGFTDFMTRCRERGLTERCLSIGGNAWDLGSREGLLSFYECAVLGSGHSTRHGHNGRAVAFDARIEGNVVIEDNVKVESGAVVVGPAFLGAGAVLGKDSFVRSAIVGPGAVVPSGGILRNRVLLDGESHGSEADNPVVTGASRAPRSLGGNFRTWKLFSYARLGKRLLDILASMVALAFLVIVLPAIAVAIKLTSKGPVFYAARRQGLHGRPFSCLKFRTMVAGAQQEQEELRAINEVDGPQFKISDDPRITTLGAFLRETNLDEIPQFLNVLAGHMSIVGPRPSPDEENQMCPSWREARLSVRPGITGLWQVSRSRDRRNDFQEWIYYDTKYVRQISLWRDLVIAVKTAWILLAGFLRLFVARSRQDGLA